MLNQLQYCEETGIPLAVIIGESELQKGVVKLRVIETREETEVPRTELVQVLKSKIAELNWLSKWILKPRFVYFIGFNISSVMKILFWTNENYQQRPKLLFTIFRERRLEIFTHDRRNTEALKSIFALDFWNTRETVLLRKRPVCLSCSKMLEILTRVLTY